MLFQKRHPVCFLNLQGSGGYCYQLEASTDLATWEALEVITTDGLGQAQFSIPIDPRFTFRWYRTVAVACE